MNRKIKYLIIILINLISITLIIGIHFLYKNFGNLSIEEIIFHLKVPMEGTDTTMINEFLTGYFPIIIGLTVLVSFLLIYPIVRADKIRKNKIEEERNKLQKVEIENIEVKKIIIEEEKNKVEENIEGQIELDLNLRNNANEFKIVKNDITKKSQSLKNNKKRKVKKAVVKVKKANVSVGAKIFVTFIIFVISVVYTINTTDVVNYIVNQLDDSSFIKNEYINPKNVKLQFPDKKKNLIYIFLESIESTYSSKEDGGGMNVDLMPELTKIAKENINFSNTDKIGGAYSMPGTTWTVAAMVSQSTGIPLKIGMDVSNFDRMEEFLPGVYGIGEILEEQGYTNYLMIGSDVKFASRDKLYKTHGNYKIWDVTTAIEEGRMTESDKVWWGYSDSDLFVYAKEEISKLADEGKPFNFTMLTADTHFPDGYVCNMCENNYSEKYYNAINCSSKQINEFIEWIKTQEFYENTTIVLVGDHLTMQTEYFDNLDVERTTYNAIINSSVKTENSKNRKFTSMDMFPTTLAAMGVKIEGDRLGIGTNLFSPRPTIIEENSIEYVKNELSKASSFYNNEFLNY